MTSSLAVYEAEIWVKSMHQIKLCLKNKKKEKYGNKINFYIKLHPKDCFGIHSLLRRAHTEEALTSFTVSDAYLQFVDQAYLLSSETRSNKEYLMPTNNIIVLD